MGTSRTRPAHWSCLKKDSASCYLSRWSTVCHTGAPGHPSLSLHMGRGVCREGRTSAQGSPSVPAWCYSRGHTGHDPGGVQALASALPPLRPPGSAANSG